MPFDALAAAAYVSIESFRRNGEAVRAPVWITAEAGSLYCWTMARSGKVKRIRRDGRVRLAACDAQGKIRGDWIEAQARALDDAADIKAQARRMRRKYGLLFLPFYLLGKLLRRPAVVIMFSPSGADMASQDTGVK